MKIFSFFTCLLFLLAIPSFAEPGPIEKIVNLLQQAKDSPNPLPLLEQAKQHMNKYNPAPNQNKETLAGRGPKKQAAASVEAHEMKGRAEKALHEAIEAAKSGSPDLKSKIDAAIAEVHHTGSEKHL